jgi:hypothetical protein
MSTSTTVSPSKTVRHTTTLSASGRHGTSPASSSTRLGVGRTPVFVTASGLPRPVVRFAGWVTALVIVGFAVLTAVGLFGALAVADPAPHGRTIPTTNVAPSSPDQAVPPALAPSTRTAGGRSA